MKRNQFRVSPNPYSQAISPNQTPRKVTGSKQRPKQESFSLRQEPLIQNNFTINIQNLENVLERARSKSKNQIPDHQQYQSLQVSRRPQSKSIAPNHSRMEDQHKRSYSIDERNMVKPTTDRYSQLQKVVCSYRTRQTFNGTTDRQNQSLSQKRPLTRNNPNDKPKFDDFNRRSVSISYDTPSRLSMTSITADEARNKPITNMAFNPIYKIICSYRTRQGHLASNPDKTNQDAYQICQNFGGKGQHLFFVCDGHGQNGHHVSNYIKNNYPTFLQALTNLPLGQAMTEATITLTQSLLTAAFDCKLSGSTFIQMMFDTTTGKVTCANVGDSRAVIGAKDQGHWVARPLSQDHKPSLPMEHKRIISHGGRVDSYRDNYGRQVGPMRVWLKNENIPGLAMSRSIGDFVAASVGVSAIPEVIEYIIQPSDKFILIASDGVWEFINNETIVKLIAPYFESGDINGACEQVMKEALYQWTQDDSSVVDDITFIMIFVDHLKKQN